MLTVGAPDGGELLDIVRDVHEDCSTGHAFELAADDFAWHRAQPCRLQRTPEPAALERPAISEDAVVCRQKHLAHSARQCFLARGGRSLDTGNVRPSGGP